MIMVFLKSTVLPCESVIRAVVQHLQQDVEHIRMCLFHLVKQHNGVRLAAHGFGQLTAFFITHVSGRRSDQTATR